jgi:guanylate kinase
MISPQTQQKIIALLKAESAYRPSPAIAEQLRAKTITMLVGASCEGKTTVMQTAAQLDPRFSISGRFTTREPRSGDNTALYTYYQNTDAGLQPLFERIEQRDVVQYAVNPYSKLVYGTDLNDYSTEYSMSDVFSSSVASVRQNSFKRVIVISIVGQPKSWLARFDERFPLGNPERRARRDEAIESFKWSLAQTADHYWIENIDGQPELAAQEIIAISLGTGEGQLQAKALAATSLDAARGIPV